MRNKEKMTKNECGNCAQAKIKNHGVFDFSCIGCCARLVASARPSRPHQESMLASIERFRNAQKRQDILDYLKQKFSCEST